MDEIDREELLRRLPAHEYRRLVLNEWPSETLHLYPIYICTRTHRQAELIARLDFELKRDDWRYVESIRSLMGLDYFEIVFCAGWYRRKEANEAYDYVQELLKLGRVRMLEFDELNKRK